MGQVAQGAAWLPQQMLEGARRGYRFGGGANTRFADMASGRFLYRHGSRGDDAAMQLERERRQTRDSYERMTEVMEQIRDKI